MASFHVFTAYLLFVLCLVLNVKSEFETTRCVCVCPDVSVVFNEITNVTSRKIYIANVEPCVCETAVIRFFPAFLKGKAKEFCPRCSCKYERRNITIIKVVVLFIIGVVSLLMIYLLFLMLLDPLLNKNRAAYEEHRDEGEEILPTESLSQPPRPSSGNVLNRIGQQQCKWKNQVREQRRNTFDKHSVLN